MTTAKVLKSVHRPGFEPMTTWKFFCTTRTRTCERLGKMQNHVRSGFELVTSRKMARRAPGLPYRGLPGVFHGCSTSVCGRIQHCYINPKGPTCSTSVPRVFHESPPNTRGTSWSVVSRGTPVEHRGPGPPRPLSLHSTQVARPDLSSSARWRLS